ncbi:MAG TPA: glutamyl-tRNA reductase [Bacillota bacterium]|nr:glutamyl-tRNA reductase [Bacillota bacterium]
MFLVAVGLNHKTAPVEIREKLAFPEGELQQPLRNLRSRQAVEGCIILSTCNRTEIYAAVLDVKQGLSSIKEFMTECIQDELVEIDNFIYVHTLYDTVHHLFRVAAGLDSMILGETQILGQVRTAYQIACDLDVTNRILNTLFQQAVTVGKRVRTDTEIDRNAVSISYAAVELSKQIFDEINGLSIMIVGAGKMSELTAKHLVSNGVTRVLVANRSPEKAQQLAQAFGGEPISLDHMFERMVEVDIVISATASSKAIIGIPEMESVVNRRDNRKIFLIDIAVPRDIDPEVGQVPGVCLYDIDDLQNVVDKNLEERKKEALKAQAIVEDEITKFFQWLNGQFVVPTISALKQFGETIKNQELEKAFKKLGPVGAREEKIIRVLAHSIVNSMLHNPIVNLKSAAHTNHGHLYTEILQNLFSLEVEGQRSKRFAEQSTTEGFASHPHSHMGMVANQGKRN